MYAPRHYCGYQLGLGRSTGESPARARRRRRPPGGLQSGGARAAWVRGYDRGSLGEFEHFQSPLGSIFFCIRVLLCSSFAAAPCRHVRAFSEKVKSGRPGEAQVE
jgi:hypothetical protein